MIRRIVWLIPIFLMAGYAFWGLEWSDYQKGYRKALEDAPRLQQEMGWAADVGALVVQSADAYPADPTQPDDWQAGYRQALHDFLQQQKQKQLQR
jgi:hypothetical protein